MAHGSLPFYTFWGIWTSKLYSIFLPSISKQFISSKIQASLREVYISTIYPTWELKERKIKWYDRRQQWYSSHIIKSSVPSSCQQLSLFNPLSKSCRDFCAPCHRKKPGEMQLSKTDPWTSFDKSIWDIFAAGKYISIKAKNSAFFLNLFRGGKTKLSHSVLKRTAFLCDQVLKLWSSFLYNNLQLLYKGRWYTNVLLVPNSFFC